jgi:dTDP-4-amino-4,6-dideoxygalactose transaminase
VRLDTIQAAVLDVKLKHLAAWNAARRQHAEQYRSLLAAIPTVQPIVEREYGEPIYHLFVIRVSRRDELQHYLSQRGVQTLLHYPLPLHLQEAFQGLGYKRGDFPNTEKLADEILSLPMYAEMTTEHIQEVVTGIKEFYSA